MYYLDKDTDFIEYIQTWSHAHSLEQKIHHTQKLLEHIAHHYAPHEVAVAWTGGKDSTVLLALWRQVLSQVHPEANVLAVNLDTGHKFPEILVFRDELAALWQVQMHIARPDWAALGCAEATPHDAYPVAKNKVQCCQDLKIKPLEKAIKSLGIKVLLTGIRADEHEERAKRGILEVCHSRTDDGNIVGATGETSPTSHTRVHAILAFTEMDIWSYTASQNIPYCSLYTKGYRSLGCVPCTKTVSYGGTDNNHNTGERAGRDADKEAAMQSLHELGYF
ncbi:MAG: phosphoadenosine phosphosulfate reductase family protein [Pseudomonadota bacterium]